MRQQRRVCSLALLVLGVEVLMGGKTLFSVPWEDKMREWTAGGLETGKTRQGIKRKKHETDKDENQECYSIREGRKAKNRE